MAKNKLPKMDDIPEETMAVTPEQDAVVPAPGSPDWTDWVLAQMEDNEKYITKDDVAYPYVKGLRRFTRSYFHIASSESKVDYVLPGQNMATVAVTHTIVLASNKIGFPSRVSGVAVKGDFNMDKFVYPGETADTIAEGRALVRLLGINRVTKDEIRGEPAPVEVRTQLHITPAQLKQLNVICRRANISVVGVAAQKQFGGCAPKDMTAANFHKLCKWIDDVSKRELTPEQEAAMQAIGNYNENWSV